MEKPSLSEVKKYFKNAAVIESVYKTNGVYSDKNIHIDREAYFCETENKVCLAIWHKKYGYAKILTYKNTEPKFEITKNQILNIYEKTSITNQEELKKWFPEAFQTVLEVGKWYYQDTYGKTIFFVTKIEEGIVYAYGTNFKGIYKNESEWFDINQNKQNEIRLATTEEVAEAFKNEAVKRYKVGDYLKNHQGTWKLDNFNIVYSERYNEGIYNRQGTGKWLCMNGVWAEVCETISKEDAEKIIGKIIL